MPPRASKRKLSAKNPSSREKSATPEAKQEVIQLNLIEENKILESELPLNLIENKNEVLEEKEVEQSIANTSESQQNVVVVKEEDISIAKPSEEEQKVVVVVKEEVFVNTTMVIEEKNLEIDSLNVVSDAKMEGSVSEEEEEDPEELFEESNENEGDQMNLNQVEEEEEDPEELFDEENENEGDQMNLDQGDKRRISEEETAAAGVEDTIEEGDGNDMTGADEGGEGEGEGDKGGSDDEDNEEDDDHPSAYMQAPLTDRKKQKEFEIFVGGLDKEAVEEDLTKVFGEFGEIQSVRIVKHPATQKSRGFAFIQYATIEQAKKVLIELKDGTEVRGKRVGISPCQDSDTLYVGNICKTWTKEQVLEKLKTLGIEHLEEIYLPDDPKKEGKSKGFGLLEFSTHSDAMASFQRLRKPDAVFGCDRSAKVAFAQSSIHPSEEALSQVKTVFVEGLTDLWDEEKLKELCKQYGEIENIQLSRNLATKKRKDFGFILFTSRESAVACVEGINSAEIGQGETKVNANLAKPQYKGRLGKKAARGGYKVKKDGTEEAGPSKMKGHAKSKGGEGKGKVPSKSRSARGGKQFKPQHSAGQRQGASASFRSDRTGRQRMQQSTRGGKRGGRSVDTGYRGRPSKKPRGNMHGRPSSGFGNRRDNSSFVDTRQNYSMGPATYSDPYSRGFSASAPSYQAYAYGAHAGSKRYYSDTEPRVGYVEPGLRRVGGYDGQGSSGTAYGGGSVQPSYVPGYSSYTGYENGGRGGGSGYGYPASGTYPPQTYY